MTDWLPTFASLANVRPQRGVDGLNQMDALTGGQPAREELYLGAGAYRYQKWKLIKGTGKVCQGDDPPKPDTYLLFDLEADPMESNNLANKYPNIRDMLIEKLMAEQSLDVPVVKPDPTCLPFATIVTPKIGEVFMPWCYPKPEPLVIRGTWTFLGGLSWQWIEKNRDLFETLIAQDLAPILDVQAAALQFAVVTAETGSKSSRIELRFSLLFKWGKDIGDKNRRTLEWFDILKKKANYPSYKFRNLETQLPNEAFRSNRNVEMTSNGYTWLLGPAHKIPSIGNMELIDSDSNSDSEGMDSGILIAIVSSSVLAVAIAGVAVFAYSRKTKNLLSSSLPSTDSTENLTTGKGVVI